MSTTTLLRRALEYQERGALDDAEAHFAMVLQQEPDHVDALYLLGRLAHQRGRHDDAVALVRRAIELSPNRAAFHNTLGDALRLLGDHDSAEQALRLALMLEPASFAAQSNLALVLHLQHRWPESLALMFELMSPPQSRITHSGTVTAEAANADTSRPDNEAYLRLRELMVQMLQQCTPPTVTDRMRTVLLRLCNDDGISTQRLANVLLAPTVSAPGFASLRASAANDRDPFDEASHAVRALLRDPLLLGALPRLVVADEQLERVLTAIRRSLLIRACHQWSLAATAAREIEAWSMRASETGSESAETFSFVCALAQQCFVMEYAFAVTHDERALMQVLRDAVEVSLDKRTSSPILEPLLEPLLEPMLALLACYMPLHALTNAQRLLEVRPDSWSTPCATIIRQQVAEVARERALRESLPTLTPITDGVSRVVREMYEENPYPRWVSAERPARIAPFPFIRRLQAHGSTDHSTTPQDATASILVAGCGTGRQPLQIAMQFSPSNVLAIDLSRSSLAYARRMAEKIAVTNITFAQGDLLELQLPDRAFDMISCSGVLHHLANPLAGWRVLLRHLAPGGVMKIGLYATRARRSVNAARSFVQQAQFSSVADDIRLARRAILDLPSTHEARAVVSFLDFYSISGCRDLFMHVQERSYTALELAADLDSLGLRFLGFQLDPTVLSRFQSMFPLPDALLDLTKWEVFETAHPETFAGMYQFWCGCR